MKIRFGISFLLLTFFLGWSQADAQVNRISIILDEIPDIDQKLERWHELKLDFLKGDTIEIENIEFTSLLIKHFNEEIANGKIEHALTTVNALAIINTQRNQIFIDTLYSFQKLLLPLIDDVLASDRKADFYKHRGAIFDYQNDKIQAVQAYKNEEQIRESISDIASLEFADVQFHLAETYMGTNEYAKASHHYDKARQLYESMEDDDHLLWVHVGHANMYSRLTLFEKALEIRTQLYLEEPSPTNISALTAAHYYEGRDFREQEDYHSEISTLQDALDLSLLGGGATKDFTYLSVADLSSAHALAGQVDSAAYYFNLLGTLYLPQKTLGWRDIFYSKTEAYYAYAKGDLTRAETACKKGILMSAGSSNFEAERRFGELMVDILEGQGKLKEAFPYIKRSSLLRDQIINATNVSRMQFLQNSYEATRKDQEIELQKSQISILHQQAISRRNRAIGGGLSLLFLLGLWQAYRSRKQSIRTQDYLQKEVKKRTQKIYEDKILIEQQTEELRALDKMKSRFFANISHELRTPLTLILSPLKRVANATKTDPTLFKYTTLALNNVAVLQERVNELLDLSKLDQASLKLKEAPHDLIKILHRAAGNFESLIHERGLQFDINVNLGSKFVAEIDEKKIEKIIYNLLYNAVKYTSSGGTITLSAHTNDNGVVISIKDTGEGISEEDLPHIFDRYFQTYNPEKQAEGGTGIGLALVQELSELMGDSVTVLSQIDKGSEFTIHLPLVAFQIEKNTNVNVIPQDDLDDKKGNLKSTINVPHLLVVEDNKELREYIADILSEHYNITTATNGRDAYELLVSPSYRPDIVLSDIMMPEMDGFELLSKIRKNERTRNLPFCFLTAKADTDDRIQALKIGVDDYLIKPFDDRELVARLNNLIDLYNNRLEAIDTTTIKETNLQETQAAITDIYAIQQKALSELTHSQFSVDFLAQQCGLTRRKLYEILKTETGFSPSHYIRELRLNKARRMLEEDGDTTINQVAKQVGFQKVSYFSALYKKRFGILPSAHQEE